MPCFQNWPLSKLDLGVHLIIEIQLYFIHVVNHFTVIKVNSHQIKSFRKRSKEVLKKWQQHDMVESE